MRLRRRSPTERAIEQMHRTAEHARETVVERPRAVGWLALATGTVLATVALLRDRDRRQQVRRRAARVVRGTAAKVASAVRPMPQYDGVTLARKVETEIFRPAAARCCPRP